MFVRKAKHKNRPFSCLHAVMSAAIIRLQPNFFHEIPITLRRMDGQTINHQKKTKKIFVGLLTMIK